MVENVLKGKNWNGSAKRRVPPPQRYRSSGLLAFHIYIPKQVSAQSISTFQNRCQHRAYLHSKTGVSTEHIYIPKQVSAQSISTFQNRCQHRAYLHSKTGVSTEHIYIPVDLMSKQVSAQSIFMFLWTWWANRCQHKAYLCSCGPGEQIGVTTIHTFKGELTQDTRMRSRLVGQKHGHLTLPLDNIAKLVIKHPFRQNSSTVKVMKSACSQSQQQSHSSKVTHTHHMERCIHTHYWHKLYVKMKLSKNVVWR